MQVSLRLDGALSDFEQVDLRAHLVRCESCRVYEAEVSEFTHLLRGAALEPLSGPIVLPRRQRPLLRQFQVAASAAAVALVAIVSIMSVGGTGVRSAVGLGEPRQAHRAPVSGRSAYLQSPDYEQRLIEQAREAQARMRAGSKPVL